MSKKLFIVSIIIFALFVNKSFSQDDLNIKANLLVLDSDGKSINDVDIEDIKIFEDGIEQKITYFAKKEPILNLGIVIDNTGSMRESLDELVLMGSTVVNNLLPTDNAFIVRFVSSDNISIMHDWTSDKSKLNSAIQQMYVEGGVTAMIDGLYLSTQKIIEREKQFGSQRFALILISDGVDRNSHYDLDQLFALYNNTDVQIFLLSFPEEEALEQIKLLKKDKQLRKVYKKPILLNNILALETGGTAYTLSKNYNKAEIVDKINSIMKELRSNYIIGYTSTNQKRDGENRKLTVQIANEKDGKIRIGSVRESFIAINKKKIK